MKLAIVVGHSPKHKGARAVDGVHEYDFHLGLAARIAAHAQRQGIEWKVLQRVYNDGLQTPAWPAHLMAGTLRGVVGRANYFMPDLVLSLHFNAAPSSHAGQFHGTEALHWPGDVLSAKWCERIAGAVAHAQGTRLRRGDAKRGEPPRGVRAQELGSDGRPLILLRDTIVPAVLLETHFGDHAGDHRKATIARDSGATARAIVDSLRGPV